MRRTGLKVCVSRRVYESPKMNLYSMESESFLAFSTGTGGDAGGTGSDFPWASDGGDAGGSAEDFPWGGY